MLQAWVLALLCGCAIGPMQPDLSRMYRGARAAPDATPVIVIPGLFGSTLHNQQTGEAVWPGRWQRVLFSDYADLALRHDPQALAVLPDDLQAGDIADRVLGIDFYGPLLRTLVEHGGYTRTEPGQRVPAGRRPLYVFPYDWRQDNVSHAAALDRLIEQIRRDHDDPGLRVDVVAHSMGGLVARYYLRYGPRDVLEGSPQRITLYGTSRVRKLVLLGTPNFGAVSALHGFLRGEAIGLGRMPPQVIASMPSAYQLFPHPLAHWLVDAQGQPLDDALYDPATWQRLGWGVFSPEQPAEASLQRFFALRLERARRLAWMLSTPEPESPIRYVLFGGNCANTPARVLLEPDGGRLHARLSPQEVRHPVPGLRYDELLLEPGDGRVTKPSLLARETLDPSAPQLEEAVLPIAYYFFLCERHDQLTSNPNFQDNLLHILLTPALPWERGGP